MAENKKLKRENSLLKEQTTFTIDMRSTHTANSTQNVVIVESSYELTEMELAAFKEAISDEFMSNQGWTVDQYGRVKDEDFQLYKAGYVTTIKKILKHT